MTTTIVMYNSHDRSTYTLKTSATDAMWCYRVLAFFLASEDAVRRLCVCVSSSRLPGLQAQYLHIIRIQKWQLMPHGCHQWIYVCVYMGVGIFACQSCVCGVRMQQTFITQCKDVHFMPTKNTESRRSTGFLRHLKYVLPRRLQIHRYESTKVRLWGLFDLMICRKCACAPYAFDGTFSKQRKAKVKRPFGEHTPNLMENALSRFGRKN